MVQRSFKRFSQAIVVQVVVVVVVAASLDFVGVLVLGFEARVCMFSVKTWLL